MNRCVSFDCPGCRRRHCQEDVVDRFFVCEGTSIYFDARYSPSLDPPPGHPSLLADEESGGLALVWFVIGVLIGVAAGAAYFLRMAMQEA